MLIYEDADGSGTWVSHPITSTVLSVVPNGAVLLPGQNLYDVTIFSSDTSLDPGIGFTGLTKKYKISVASPDHATANSSSNPKEFFIDITFRNECRDIIVSSQVLPMIENTILSGTTTIQTVPDFAFTPNLSTCGTQSISIYEDGTNAVPYSDFLTTSGMDLHLYSDTSSHAGDYYVKVEVTFSAFPMTYRNSYDMLVRLKPSCRDDTFTGATWVSSGANTIAVYDHVINAQTDTHVYSPTVFNSFSADCTMSATLEEETSPGVWAAYTGTVAVLDTSF